jgi:prepilin-type processing-associated H-X9-DG protein
MWADRPFILSRVPLGEEANVMMTNHKQRTAFTLIELPAVSRNKCGAFTLVELLVVVGIIAVVIGMLLPALMRARKSANSTVCLSNLHQLILANELYAAVYKGSTLCDFTESNATAATSSGISWLDALAPYLTKSGAGLNAVKINSCPSAPIENADGGASVQRSGSVSYPYSAPSFISGGNFVAGNVGSYGMNYSVMQYTSAWGNYGGVDASGNVMSSDGANLPAGLQPYFWTKFSQRPDENVPVYCDAISYYIMGSNVYAPVTKNPGVAGMIPPPASFFYGGATGLQRACIDRHSGGINVAFKDGSCRHVNLRDLWDLRWNRQSPPLSQYLKFYVVQWPSN